MFAYQIRGKSSDRSVPPLEEDDEVSFGTALEPVGHRPLDHSSAKPAPPPESIKGLARIIDGDTIVIKRTQIRLFGIDAPELDYPYGQKAKWALVRLCKGQAIRAEILQTDAYGRTVAKCYLEDSSDLSSEMVKLGLALDCPKFSGGKYRHLEVADARKKMWLADARQKGRMYDWEHCVAQKKNEN